MTAIQIISLVFLGGGAGSLSRFGISQWMVAQFPTEKFPIGTLISNFLACLILGMTLYLLREKMVENEWVKYLIIVGFCGGFSTFSTFSLETVKLLQNGFFAIGILNIVFSLALGFLVLWFLVKN